MQLGMVGLGRMGANLTRRLMRGGHEVVVYDVNADSVHQLEGEGSIGTGSLEDFVSKLSTPRAAWVMVPAAFAEQTTDALAELMEPGDIVIDGGNSYYRDDIDRAERYADKGVHFVDVGTSGGVFGLERGFCLMIGGEDEVVQRLDPIFATIAPGVDAAERTPGRTDSNATTAEAGYLHCGPPRRRTLREDGPQRHRVRAHGRVRRRPERAQARERRGRRARGRRRDHAAPRPEVLPLRPEHPRDHRGVAPWERGGLVAARPDGRRARSRTPSSSRSGGACRTRARAGGPCSPPWTRACPVHVLSAALLDRFESRGEAEFANKILSAMRKQFGGHAEKTD